MQINKRIIKFGNFALVGMLVIMLIIYILKMIPVKQIINTGIGGIEDTSTYINFSEIHTPVKSGNSGMNITYLQVNVSKTLFDKINQTLFYRNNEQTPVIDVFNPKSDIDETDKKNHAKWTTEHQNQTLTTIAIKYAHLPYAIKSYPTVAYTYDKFKTGKVFKKNDIIMEYNNQKVFSVYDISQIRKSLKVEQGNTVNYKVLRDGKSITIPITYTEKTNKGFYSSGIFVYDKKFFRDIDPNKLFHFGVNFSGDSAGLMMTLGLIEKLNPVDDLTKGYKIAGTGTIDVRENVGEIGGIKLKVRTAEKNHVDYFFVPKSHNKDESNEKDATETASLIKAHVKIVPVASVGEALEFLGKLPLKK